MNNKNLALKAPLSGPVMPLNRVPDPVFSSGTLGEGIAIDPLNDCLHAPCAGLVSHLARTRHALSLRADNGAELLLHVGLDTVQLQGEGFEALVEEGARVIEGQPLLRFDLDRVARGSRSLITVMILTNGDGFQVRPLTTNPVEVGAPLLQLSPEKAEQRPANPAPGEGSAQRQVRGRARVAHHGGLHARPAALLRKTAQGFSSQAELHFAGQVASVDSLVGIMGLGVAEQDEVEVICRGEDSEAALDALLAALASATAGLRRRPRAPSPRASRRDLRLSPVPWPASALRPAWPAVPWRGSAPSACRRMTAGIVPRNSTSPWTRPCNGCATTYREPAAGQARRRRERSGDLSAHLALLEDPGLLDAADMLIDQGVGAAHAWHRAIQAQCEILQALGNLLLAERANDLRDLEKRVLRVLLGDTAPLRVPAGAIVAAREITPPTSRRWWMPARLACAWPKAAPPPTWPSSPVARACRAWWRSAPGCWSWRKAGR